MNVKVENILVWLVRNVSTQKEATDVSHSHPVLKALKSIQILTDVWVSYTFLCDFHLITLSICNMTPHLIHHLCIKRPLMDHLMHPI